MSTKDPVTPLMKEIRTALADYVKSEGCSCCQNTDVHNAAAERLGQLLHIKKYSDGSGRDFYAYATKKARKI